MPPAWREAHYREVTGSGLAEAYIRFFEPDVFVECDVGLAKEAGVASQVGQLLEERVVPFKQFVRDGTGRRADFAFGLSAFDIYGDLYREEFKFAPRKPRKVAIFEESDPYCEAVFGDFPLAPKLQYLRKAYIDVCEPAGFAATPAACLKLLKDRHFTPLAACLYKLDVTFENRDDPSIFVFDPTKTVDLIDFWNLRQFRTNLLPINIRWMSEFADLARKAVKRNYRPLPGNKNGVMIRTTLEFGRSIDQTTKNAVVSAHFRDLPAGSLSLKDWYDPIWRTDWRSGGIQPRRAKLAADRIDIEETVDERDAVLRFPSPEPKFASKRSFANNSARWANTINFSDFADNSSFALTFPPNVKGEEFPRLDFGGMSLASREGVTLLRRYKSLNARLRLMPKRDAIVAWLKSRGFNAKPSSSGRNAEEVLRALGGARGASLLADEGTVKLLNKMAKTIQREADGTTAQYPDRTASISEWKEVLGRRSRSLFSRTKLSELTKANVMRIGLTLSCPNCAQENWYSLGDVDYEVACERCLGRFSFPQTGLNYNEGDWRYRVLGPFTVPNFADGAYATVLTLRLFTSTLRAGHTPTAFATGLDIELGAEKFEVDFVGWYSEDTKFWIDPEPVVVFGEAKSFGIDSFKERDVHRLKMMTEALPGSYVVFSAMKKELSNEEKRRIKKFAEWGRVPHANGQPRAMVIVLTGTELFADHNVEQTWRQIGGAHARMVEHPSVHIDDLWTLADVTQQLYLGLPAYWDWRRRRSRTARRGTQH